MIKHIKRMVSLLEETYQVRHLWIVEVVAYDGSTAHVSNHRSRKGAQRALDKVWREYLHPDNRSISITTTQLRRIKKMFLDEYNIEPETPLEGVIDLSTINLGLDDYSLKEALILEGIGPRLRREKVLP